LGWGETTLSWGETTWGEMDLGQNDLFLSSFGGAGVAAMVGASNAGSLSFGETCLVTTSTVHLRSLLSELSPLAVECNHFFFTLTTFEFHSFLRWLYFLVTIAPPVLVVAAPKFT